MRTCRTLALVATVAGCAQGGKGGLADASIGTQHDAKEFLDGAIEPQIDAAQPHPDAAIDAPIMNIDAPPPPPPPDACVPQVTELLLNPVFDLTPVGTNWVQQPYDVTYPLVTADDGIAEHSAPYKAWLGGIEPSSGTATDLLYQDVLVPAMTTQLRLTGYYEVRSGEDPGDTNVYDTGNLALTQTNGTPIESVLSLTNVTVTTAWTPINKTFAGNLSGQTVRLRFTTTNDAIAPFPFPSGPTSFYFDTLSLKATHGCP